jgi:hypothetical protein
MIHYYATPIKDYNFITGMEIRSRKGGKYCFISRPKSESPVRDLRKLTKIILRKINEPA